LTALHAQEDLFATEASSTEIDSSFATVKRITLDDQSWVDVMTGWMAGSQILLDTLVTVVPWQQHDRVVFHQKFREPRLTGEYGSLELVPAPILTEACRALSRHYDVLYDGLWLNFYRDGKDSSGWHRDRPACRLPRSIVPVLTLGATRRFLVRPYAGGRSMVFKPQSGDLIVMGGRAQIDWVHSVPKEPGIVEPRVSINFQSSSQTVNPNR
jgi:alkylated DNA repair dioxygenase AlkB